VQADEFHLVLGMQLLLSQQFFVQDMELKGCEFFLCDSFLKYLLKNKAVICLN